MAKIFSSRQVGRLLGADPSSVNRWIDSGRLKAYRTPGGHRRVLYEDLLAFLDACGIPVPEELRPEQVKVLLVDGDEQYLKSLRKALLRADKKLLVQISSQLTDALLTIGSMRPDVVMLNLSLAGSDGLQICSRIRGSATGGVKVIGIVEKQDAGLERKAAEAGVSAVLVKGFKTNAVLELLQPG